MRFYLSRSLHTFFLLASITADSASASEDYLLYVNERYGYEISYPATFIAHGVADAGDGQIFTSSAQDAELRVYTSLCIPGENLTTAEFISKQTQAKMNRKVVVTYQRRGDGFAMVSGKINSRVFYRKLLIRDGRYTQFSFEYEYAQKKKYGAFAARIVSSFRLPPE